MKKSLRNFHVDQQGEKRFFSFVMIFALLLLSVTLAVYVYRGFYSRYWADDYCQSATLREYGLFGGTWNSYQTWSNRFSAIFLVGVSELFGAKAISFLPAIVILCNILIYALLFYLTFRLKKWKVNLLVSFLISLVFTYFLLLLSPNLFQSIYWRSGMISYFAPLLFLGLTLIVVCLDVLHGIKKCRFVIFFLLALILGGFSETFGAFQVGLWLLTLLLSTTFLKKQNRNILKQDSLYLLAGSLVSLAVIAVAPGNFVRLSSAHAEFNFWNLVPLSLKYAAAFVFQAFRSYSLPNLILFVEMFVIGLHIDRGAKKSIHSTKTMLSFFAFLFLFSCALLICIAAPSVFTMQAYPEERSWMIGRFVTVLVVMLAGFGAGVLSQDWFSHRKIFSWLSIIVLLILNLYPLKGAWAEWQQLPQWKTVAQAWDRRNAQILDKIDEGETSLTVQALDSIGTVAELTDDPNYWVNVCAANYYGVDEITALEYVNE